MTSKRCLLFFVAEDWYFELHFLQFALAAKAEGWRVALICNIGQKGPEVMERIREANIEIYPVLLARTGLTPVMDIRALFYLSGLVKKLRPTLLHAVALKPIILSQVVSRLYKIPLLAMITGLGYIFTSKTVKAFLAKPFIRLALQFTAQNSLVRFVVLNSEDSAWAQKTFVYDKDQISIIPGTGVDMQRFYPGSGLAASPFKIAYVGRMLRDKGVFELIDAIKLLKSSNANIELVLAGAPDDSNPESIKEAQLLEWQSAGFCKYLGHISEIEDLLRQVHAVALPSYREGLGMSLLEAAASGIPTVATDVPGCRSAVVNEKTGLLVPPKDSHALGKAIARLADDPDLCQQLGRNALRYVRENFAREIVLISLIELYNRMTVGQGG